MSEEAHRLWQMGEGNPRITLPVRARRELEKKAELWGTDPADVIELLLAAYLDGGADDPESEAARSRWIIEEFEADRALNLQALRQQMPAPRLALLRMGPDRTSEGAEVPSWGAPEVGRESLPVDDPPDGYPRRWIGMRVNDKPEDVWQAARGYWRLRPDIEYLAPSRHGYVPYVFRVGDWKPWGSTKYFAGRGWLIDVETGQRVGFDGDETGELPRLAECEPASAHDLEVARAVAGQVIAMGLRGTNPVIRP